MSTLFRNKKFMLDETSVTPTWRNALNFAIIYGSNPNLLFPIIHFVLLKEKTKQHEMIDGKDNFEFSYIKYGIF